jgi:OOP family OmpA-OmpF porin
VRRLERSLLVLALSLLVAAAALADEATDEGAAPPAPESASLPAVESAPPLVRKVVLRGIKFGSDTAYIEPASAGVLELVAERMRENPDVRVRIEGHTDERASEAYNLELSKERAEAVKRILIGFGIAEGRLDAVGVGESQPVASNDTPEGRSLNRRVELKVLE